MELNLDEIRKQFTHQRQAKSSRTRFRFDAKPEEVAALLRHFYLLELNCRGQEVSGLDKFTTEKIDKVSRWLTVSNKAGLFLCGDVGTGKTTMARAVVGLINAAGASGLGSEKKCVVSATAKELAEMKSAHGAGSVIGPEAFFDNRKCTEMLFIDDLGTEPTMTKRWGNDQTPVMDVLFYRYDQQLFTIATSNLDSQNAIEEKYGLRIADRMREMFDFVSYSRKSYRK